MGFLYNRILNLRFTKKVVSLPRRKRKVPLVGSIFLLAKSYIRRFSGGFNYSDYPLVDRKYVRDMHYVLPRLMHMRNSFSEYYLTNIRGIEEKFIRFTHDKRGLSVDSTGMYLKSTMLKSSNEEELENGGYFADFFKLHCRVPSDFLYPQDYRETRSSIELGIIEKKRGKRRRYSKSIFYGEWEWYKESYNNLLGSYMIMANKGLLESKSKLFCKIPQFDKDKYVPRNFTEAIYFFSLYGAPSKKRKDRYLAHVFLLVYFSGFFLDTRSFSNPTYEFVHRTIAMDYAGDLAALEVKREQEYIPERRLDESPLFYKVRLMAFNIVKYIKSYTVNAMKSFYSRKRAGLRVAVLSRYYKYLRFREAFSTNVSSPVTRRINPINFSRNAFSYVWSSITHRFEVWWITFFILMKESFEDSSIEILADGKEASDPAEIYDEFTVFRVVERIRGTIFDFILYPISLFLRPFIEILVVFPMLLVRDRLLSFWLSLYILRNNLWYAMLMMRGRWWKLPFIFIKSVIKIILGLIFIWIFIVIVDYRVFLPPAPLSNFIPLDMGRGEYLVFYNCIVIYTAVYLFGSYSLKEYLVIELGFFEYLAWITSMILWSWRVEPSFGLYNYFSDSWASFSGTLFGDTIITRDMTTSTYVSTTWIDTKDYHPQGKFHGKRVFWKLEYIQPAMGEDSPIAKEFNSRAI
jgi:hypothetical protein